MNTLIIYDTTGHIISQMSGSVYEPVGIPFLRVEVQEGRYPVRVDVTKNPHVVVLSDPPRDLVAEKLQELDGRMTANEVDKLMLLEAMASVYEEVLPFLPEP